MSMLVRPWLRRLCAEQRPRGVRRWVLRYAWRAHLDVGRARRCGTSTSPCLCPQSTTPACSSCMPSLLCRHATGKTKPRLSLRSVRQCQRLAMLQLYLPMRT